jgi:transcriptional regulator with PAS, ATPase and Fis domain
MNKDTLIAKSVAMRQVLEQAQRAACADTTILIAGESGTGKERLARFIHAWSKRRAGPFVPIDCGALPESLLEAELFGYQKGAFTGATVDKEGLCVAAAGGTLFLDEIGNTSPMLQLRLLRVLQERTVRPVGATHEIAVDVRIIAATNRDLKALVHEHAFRQDLFYRLCVVQLDVPPLRERREDLMPLAQYFLSRVCAENDCGPCTFSPEVRDVLLSSPWLGNVRELENVIERAVVLAQHKPTIMPADLPLHVQGDDLLPLTEVERRHILTVLRHMDGNRRKTAKVLGIGENTLWRKLKHYGMITPH